VRWIRRRCRGARGEKELDCVPILPDLMQRGLYLSYTPTRVSGHCFCRSIRFEVNGPEKFACLCYCESCQRAAGAPVVAWATYEKESFEVKSGTMCWRQSSPGATRGHCSDCGSTITYENEQRPGEIDITVNSLDDPVGPILRAHIWTEDKQPWTIFGDELPVYKQNIGQE